MGTNFTAEDPFSGFKTYKNLGDAEEDNELFMGGIPNNMPENKVK